MIKFKEIIKIGQLELNFLLDGNDTNNSMVSFEFIIPAGAKVPVPHHHDEVDELIYGLEGITTTTMAGVRYDIGPGQHCFVPRGVIHHHDNKFDTTAKSLVVLTPSSIGPDYFREIAAIVNAGGPPDQIKMKEIMLRHGLIPSV